MISQRRLLAYTAFAAVTVPFGIATHLIAELAGLGYRDDSTLIFSGRHLYLIVLACISLAALRSALAGASAEHRRIAAQLTRALPFGGCGPGFAAFSFITQLGFFFVTQVGEGCPLQTGDWCLGCLTALAASAASAIVIALCKTQLIHAVIELFSLLAAQARDERACATHHRLDAHIRVWRCRALMQCSANLPPPLLTPS